MDTRISASKVWLAFVCAMVPAAARAQDEPAKMAATARFDLTGDARTGSLENGRVVAGNGTVVRMNWVPEADQPRGYTVSFAGYARWLAIPGDRVHADPFRHRHLELDGPVGRSLQGGDLPRGSPLG